jgi:hypothetical protein
MGISTAIFRICQEALTNAARHAQATTLKVTLKRSATSLTFVVADNGVGIPPEKIQSESSLGLQGMRERVFAFDGKLHISSRKHSGTTIIARIPLAPDNR